MRGSFAVVQPTSRALANCSSRGRRAVAASCGKKVLLTPPPPPSAAPLLLEGDEYITSNEGIARTFYQVVENPLQSASVHPSLSVEEFFDIQSARKKFVLRETNSQQKASRQMQSREEREGIVNLGEPIQFFDFQEINEGISSGAGTGSCTWESSLAMSMFFSSRPEMLNGNVIELGSGTGAGGILISSLTKPRSVTLTDCNSKILEQCKENIAKTGKKSLRNLNVSKLDWYDFVHHTKESQNYLHKYDTVIACDCAYLYPDIVALSTAMIGLLRKSSQSRIHIFSPYNRGAVLDLLSLLRKDKQTLNVETEWIDMKRFRLEPPSQWSTSIFSAPSAECPFAATSDARFVHITCSFKQKKHKNETPVISMSEID